MYDQSVVTSQKNPYLHESANVAIRRLSAADGQEFVRLVKASTRFLSPWVVLPGSCGEFDDYFHRFDGISAECILICLRETGAIVGTVSISDIRRGPYRRATVGYNSFADSARKGYMSEGILLVFRLAFEELGLHRLEADIQPGNVPSLKFAEKVGFRQEGYSPAFIYINGTWRDHERWAINSDIIAARTFKLEKP